MRYFLVVLGSLFLFSGCAVLEPNFELDFTFNKDEKSFSENNITKKMIEKNVSIVSTLFEEKIIQNDNLETGNIILNVFDDELHFEKDKISGDKTEVVIQYLDAFDWEKKALRKIYRKHKRLWSKKQSKDFRKVLEEDKYLSLCADRRYWDNLEFEQNEPERDILHSILLIKYLNNLANGCPKWVNSNAKIKGENFNEYINTKQVFSLLPHNVIIKKLLSLYLPREKAFRVLLEKHKASLESDIKSEILKEERLELEHYKRINSNPSYKKRK